ncbi:SEFIR domain-containing protein [Mycolicibacterium parafortuitum]|uniref:SEFIR domain-containing protein n=1 Tax=Mycolicibacterium parafortuitum TaxID=39692 RepID=UPI0032C4698C
MSRGRNPPVPKCAVPKWGPAEADDGPRVFVSYSYDSDDHRRRVLDLTNELRSYAVDARIDRFSETPPPPSWPHWMYSEIQSADFVLLVCTENYQRKLLGDERPVSGGGVHWEGAIITEHAYRSDTAKFIPLVLSSRDIPHIPYFLCSTSFYEIDTLNWGGLEQLLRRIYNEPEIKPRKLGRRPTFPLNAETGNVARQTLAATSKKSDIAVSIDAILAGIHLAQQNEVDASAALLRVRRALDAFAKTMTRLLGVPCRATVFQFVAGGERAQDVTADFLATSSSSHKVASTRQAINIEDSPTLRSILSGSTWAYVKNSNELHPPAESTNSPQRTARSIAVWPIRHEIDPPAQKSRYEVISWHNILGILVVESSSENAFDEGRDAVIGELFAALLYSYLSQLI